MTVITTTSGTASTAPGVGPAPPSWPRPHTGRPGVEGLRGGGVGSELAQWWVDRQFAQIVAANWNRPVQDRPAPRRRPALVGTLARPRQPDNRGCIGPGFGAGGPLARPVVDAPGGVVSRQRSPPISSSW
jgi:hypothetical protein